MPTHLEIELFIYRSFFKAMMKTTSPRTISISISDRGHFEEIYIPLNDRDVWGAVTAARRTVAQSLDLAGHYS